MKVYLAVYGDVNLGNFPRKFLATDFVEASLKAKKIMDDSGYSLIKSLLDEQTVEIVELN